MTRVKNDQDLIEVMDAIRWWAPIDRRHFARLLLAKYPHLAYELRARIDWAYSEQLEKDDFDPESNRP